MTNDEAFKCYIFPQRFKNKQMNVPTSLLIHKVNVVNGYWETIHILYVLHFQKE